jgi:PAS domain S-box-containing protein
VKFSLKHVLAVIPVIATLAFLYVKTNEISPDDHERFERNVRSVELLDATLNQDVLKNRLTLLENYDGLPMQIAELRKTVQELGQIPSFITGAPRESIQSKVARIEVLLGEKDQLQERFKSQNAILNNSFSYLSMRGSEVLRGVHLEESGRELRTLLDELLRQVFVFGFHNTPENTAEVQASLEKLADWRSRNPEHPEALEVRSLSTHVKSIVSRKPEVDTLTSALVSVPISPLAEDVLRTYYTAFGAAMGDAEQFRFALYGLCALLAGGVCYAMFALNLSNRHLERRVSERTADLSQKNAELETEIAERQRAEKRLAEQEHRIRTILESEPECVKVVGRDGSLLEMNPAGLKMIEADRLEDVVGKQVNALLHPEHRAAFEALHQAILRGESRILQFEIVGCKGTRRWVETHACPLRDSDNEIVAHLAVTRDITEQKRSEKELAYERDVLRTLMENCPDQIYFKDLESRFIRCSRALVERFQAASSDDLVGKTDFDFFSDVHAQPALEDEQKVIRTGEPVVGKIEKEVWKDQSSKVTWALTTKMPFKDRDGAVIGTIGISKDITAIKEAEVQLEAMNKQLFETSRQAGMAEVATSVLHNVGNVLNSVNVSCSVVTSTVRGSSNEMVVKIADLFREHAADLGTFLTNDQRGQKIPEFLRKVGERLVEEQATILGELTQLTEHIGHIKEIVAMQQSYGKISGVKELVQVSDLVEDSLRMNTGALTRHEVEAVRDYANVPPVSVEKHKVLQILVNLIRNAKYACDESGRSDKQMILRVSNGSGHVRVSVIDNGVGIPRENLTRIFNHGFTTRKDGHGFGLHSAVLAAQDMGGRLSVHSDGPGTGAAFTLELPLRNSGKN